MKKYITLAIAILTLSSLPTITMAADSGCQVAPCPGQNPIKKHLPKAAIYNSQNTATQNKAAAHATMNSQQMPNHEKIKSGNSKTIRWPWKKKKNIDRPKFVSAPNIGNSGKEDMVGGHITSVSKWERRTGRKTKSISGGIAINNAESDAMIKKHKKKPSNAGIRTKRDKFIKGHDKLRSDAQIILDQDNPKPLAAHQNLVSKYKGPVKRKDRAK